MLDELFYLENIRNVVICGLLNDTSDKDYVIFFSNLKGNRGTKKDLFLYQTKTCSGFHIFKIISQISQFLVLNLQKSSIKYLSINSHIERF